MDFCNKHTDTCERVATVEEQVKQMFHKQDTFETGLTAATESLQRLTSERMARQWLMVALQAILSIAVTLGGLKWIIAPLVARP